MGRSRRWAALILAGLLVFLGAACSGGDDESAGSADSGASFGREASGGGEEMALEDGDASGAATASRSGMEIPAIGPSVIKTADLEVEVPHDGFQDAFQSVVDIAQKNGGFIFSSRSTGEKARSGSITLRVPADSFESALNDISSLGDVGPQGITSEDVSEQFIDLEARLRNLSSQEAVMLRLMDRANTITGTIRVQNELTRVQLEIEQLRGRLRFLQDQTDFSTITVRLNEAGVVAPKEPSTIAHAWTVARDTTGAIVSGLLIGGAAVLPILTVLIFVLLFARWVWPKVSRVTDS